MVDKKRLAAIAGAASGAAVSRADLALVAGGLATAAGAVAFAGYMTMSGGRGPMVNGIEYLAIFAQPNHTLRTPEIDAAPLGAIAGPAKDRVGGYSLVGAQPRFAWLRDGNRIFAVRPGDEVPRLGRVAVIAEREGRWELQDDKGATLIASAFADPAPTAGGRFDKKMIFGGK